MGTSSLGIPVEELSWLYWYKTGLPTAEDTCSSGIRSWTLWNRVNILNTSKHAPWLWVKCGQFQLLWLPHHGRCNSIESQIKPAAGKGTKTALSGRWINMRHYMRKTTNWECRFSPCLMRTSHRKESCSCGMNLRNHFFGGLWFAQTLGLRTWTAL